MELYAQARSTYESGENRKEPVHLWRHDPGGRARPGGGGGRPGSDGPGGRGPVPEAAVNVPLTREKVEGQLSRTGGTPYL